MIKGKMGFEFEGFISNENEDILKLFCKKNKIEMGNDGSVNIDEYKITEDNISLNPNEYKAIELRGKGFIFNIKDTTKLFKLIDSIYKIGFKVNSSCGLHIHISFKENSNYYKLLKYEFVKQFENRIKELFITDYEKLRFNNHYCNFYIDEKDFKLYTHSQIINKAKVSTRYKAINFNSFNLYKTIEFRIFPATKDINTFKKYVTFLLKNIEDYLSITKSIELNINKQIEIKENKPIIIIIKKTTDNRQQLENPQLSGPEQNLTDNTTDLNDEQILNLTNNLREVF